MTANLIAPNGAAVSVADSKVEGLLRRGFTKPQEAPAKKAAAKKAAAKKAASSTKKS